MPPIDLVHARVTNSSVGRTVSSADINRRASVTPPRLIPSISFNRNDRAQSELADGGYITRTEPVVLIGD
jgi:hypothetical protein